MAIMEKVNHMMMVMDESFDIDKPGAMDAFIEEVISHLRAFARVENIGLDAAVDRVSITHKNGSKIKLREIIEKAF